MVYSFTSRWEADGGGWSSAKAAREGTGGGEEGEFSALRDSGCGIKELKLIGLLLGKAAAAREDFKGRGEEGKIPTKGTRAAQGGTSREKKRRKNEALERRENKVTPSFTTREGEQTSFRQGNARKHGLGLKFSLEGEVLGRKSSAYVA